MPAAAEQALTRPWREEGQVFTTLVASGMERMGTLDQRSLVFSGGLNRYVSDELDFRMELLAAGVEGTSLSAGALTLGAGFTYWPNARLSISPTVRVGAEQFNALGLYARQYTAEVLVERTFSIASSENSPFYLDRYFLANVRLSYQHRDFFNDAAIWQRSTNVASIYASAGYDFPLEVHAGVMGRLRARGVLSYEYYGGNGTAIDSLVSVSLAVRALDVTTGLNNGQIQIIVSSNLEDYSRVILGVSRDF